MIKTMNLDINAKFVIKYFNITPCNPSLIGHLMQTNGGGPRDKEEL